MQRSNASILTLKIGYLKLLAIFIANPFRRTTYP